MGDVEVVNQSGFNEVVLHHRASGTLLATDFLYFGAERSDSSGWPQLGACTSLYYEAFCRSVPPSILLPSYRLGLQAEDRRQLAASLQHVLLWKPSRLLSARAGRISSGGVEEAAKLLR